MYSNRMNKNEVINILKDRMKRYAVSEAYIFGSFLDAGDMFHDIDIGVVMKNKRDFFKLYSDIVDSVDYSVDLVPLHVQSKFVDLVKRDGIKIYG